MTGLDTGTGLYTAVGIAEATTDTPGLTYDPTWATLTIAADIVDFGSSPQGGTLRVTFDATGVAIDQPFPVSEASSTAILFAMVGAGLFVANRRRGVLRHNGAWAKSWCGNQYSTQKTSGPLILKTGSEEFMVQGALSWHGIDRERAETYGKLKPRNLRGRNSLWACLEKVDTNSGGFDVV